MSEEYIKREDAVNLACPNGFLVEALEALPAADVAPVRHGRWVDTGKRQLWDDGYSTLQLRCSACGRPTGRSKLKTYRYCPSCGAKMQGGEDE